MQRIVFNTQMLETYYQATADISFSRMSTAKKLLVCEKTLRKYKKEIEDYCKKQDKLRPDMKRKRAEVKKMTANKRKRFSRILRPSFRRRIVKMLQKEYTVKEVLAELNIPQSTFFNWYKQHPDFKAECQNARLTVLADIKGSLIKRALGGTYQEVTETEETDNLGNVISKKKVIKRKKYLGDVNAQKFYLKNRDGWSEDPHNVENTNQGAILDALTESTAITPEEEGLE